MPRKSMLPPDAPAWVTEDRRIDEMMFCCSFLEAFPMKCVHGKLYTVEGLVPDEAALKREIFMEICDWVKTGTARKVEDLMKAVKMMAFADEIPLHQDRIHVSNGTWYLDGHFSEEKEYCRNRLDVSYNPAAGTPNVWLKFLSELLVPEDIPTLQEYLGYCLLPTTRAQKMLLMIGKGGEGKSRVGLVMKSILGVSMNTTSIQKVETNKFARADLEDRLLMVDDDMDMSALTKTNYIKSIVTSECQMIAEKEGILLWCLEGLKRLIANDYRFTISERSKENIAAIVKDANNILEFLASEGYLTFHEDSKAATSDLYAAYREWCDDNAENALSMKSFANFLSQYAETYHLIPDNNIYRGKGKRCRGYRGVEVIDHDNPFLK